jgi:hypothetical protein
MQLDLVIANHFLEHCQIRGDWQFRVLKAGDPIFAIPTNDTLLISIAP